MRIRQNNTMLVRLKAWLGKDVKVKTAAGQRHRTRHSSDRLHSRSEIGERQ